MGTALHDCVLQRIALDNRIVSATALVAAVALIGRFYDPTLQTLRYAGLLAGVVNAPRTNKWEGALKFGALPGMLTAVVVALVLALGIPLGFYEFPFFTYWETAANAIGPVIEFQIYLFLFTFEGLFAFIVVRKITGPAAISDT